MFFAFRNQRGAIEVSGDEAGAFLNDLLTAELAQLDVGSARAACLLTPQGRILFDMMVYRVRMDCYWLALDAAEVADFHKKLMMYRLRRPVHLAKLDMWQSAMLFGDDADKWQTEMQAETRTGAVYAFADPRDPALGVHLVSAEGRPEAPASAQLCEEADWHKLRISRNVPEGAVDLARGRALMLEAGLDKLAAVDFKKGCYIGQEVTARTHYRGLVKRRIVPVYQAGGHLQTAKDIHKGEVAVGQILSCDAAGTMALASVRLDAIHACQADAAGLLVGGAEIELRYPEDWPPLPALS